LAASSPGTHISSGISRGPGDWTVYVRDLADPAHPLDFQNTVHVLAAGGNLPIIITNPGGPGPGPIVLGKGLRKRRPIKGEAAAGSAYVICHIYEVDSAAHTRVLIAAGASTVKKSGQKYKWKVADLSFTIKKPNNFQYIARVTAYDKDDTSLGTQTKQIKK
jgi:hypothetical protein